MVLDDRPRDRLQHHGLTGPGCRHNQPALALADGGDEIHDAGAVLTLIMLQIDPFLRVERGQVIEKNLVPRDFGIFQIDLLDLQEGKVSFALLRGADLAGHGVACPEVETPDLGRRNIDVVGSRQVIGVGGAKEPETVRERLQHPFPVNDPVLFSLGLENGEDQLLLAQVRGSVDLQIPGNLVQLCDVALFKLGQIHDRLFCWGPLGHITPLPPMSKFLKGPARNHLTGKPPRFH